MKNSQTEVRINEKVHQKNGRNGKRGRKKRKRSFKWNGAFKSFGHYLLNLNWKDRVRNNLSAKISAAIIHSLYNWPLSLIEH